MKSLVILHYFLTLSALSSCTEKIPITINLSQPIDIHPSHSRTNEGGSIGSNMKVLESRQRSLQSVSSRLPVLPERERDRRNGGIHLKSFSYPHNFPLKRRVFINDRVMRERNTEIRREIEKAKLRKENILTVMEQRKRLGMKRLPLTAGAPSQIAFDQNRRWRREQYGVPSKNTEIDRQREKDRIMSLSLKKERQVEALRIEELSKLRVENKKTLTRERDRAEGSKLSTKPSETRDQLQRRRMKTDHFLELQELQRRDRLSHDKWKHRSKGFRERTGYGTNKAPILILEKVPVPVDATDSYLDSPCRKCYEDEYFVDENFDQTGPEEVIVIDRRPDRPIVHPEIIEEEVVVNIPPVIHKVYPPVNIEVSRINELHQLSEIERIRQTKLALAAEAQAAYQNQLIAHELNKRVLLAQKFRQQAALAHAHNQHIAFAHVAAANEQAKLAHAANEEATFNRAAHEQAAFVQAANKETALANAVSQQAILDQSAINEAKYINAASNQAILTQAAKNEAGLVSAATNQAILTQAAQNKANLDAAVSQQVINQAVNQEATLAIAQAVRNKAYQQTILNEAAKKEVALTNLASQNTYLNEVAGQTVQQAINANQNQIDLIELSHQIGLQNALKIQLDNQIIQNKIQGVQFLERIQSSRNDLINRLSLLRPYFTAEEGGLIVPEYIPQIPLGAHMTFSQLSSLPQLHIKGIHLIGSGFQLPQEIGNDVDFKIDIPFIEFILRFPEIIFQQMMQVPKCEFLVALFPGLYRETVSHFNERPSHQHHQNFHHSTSQNHRPILFSHEGQNSYISENPGNKVLNRDFVLRDPEYRNVAVKSTTLVPIPVTDNPVTLSSFHGISVRPKGEGYPSTLASTSYRPPIFFDPQSRTGSPRPVIKTITPGYIDLSTVSPLVPPTGSYFPFGVQYGGIDQIDLYGKSDSSTLSPNLIPSSSYKAPLFPTVTPRPVGILQPTSTNPFFSTTFKPPTSTFASISPIDFSTVVGGNSITVSSTPASIIPTSSTVTSYGEATPTNYLDPFRGFSGNVRQKTALEILLESSGESNNLSRYPGTDVNDDSHVVSPFNKKQGNVTTGNDTDISNKEQRGKKLPMDIDRTDNSLTSDQLSSEDQERLSVHNYSKGDEPKTSTELVINKIKEITSTFEANEKQPQEFPTVIEYQDNLTPKADRSNQFYDSYYNSMDGTSDLSSADSESTQRSYGDSYGNNRIESQKVKPIPKPTRINSSANLPGLFNNNARINTVLPQHLKRHEGFQSQRFAQPGVVRVPEYLKQEPDCAVTEDNKKSFCLYPNSYPKKKADILVKNYQEEIAKFKHLINILPKPELDLRTAYQQLPNLQLNVPCESIEKEIELSWTRDILGSWLAILQTEPYKQIVSVTTCSPSARESGCRPLLQPKPLIAFHPQDPETKPLLLEFPLPVACVMVNP